MNIRDLNLMIKKYSSLNMRDKGKNILRSSSVFIKGKKFTHAEANGSTE